MDYRNKGKSIRRVLTWTLLFVFSGETRHIMEVKNMLELFFEPFIVAISVGVGALCVINGLQLIRDFIYSHLNDEGP